MVAGIVDGSYAKRNGFVLRRAGKGGGKKLATRPGGDKVKKLSVGRNKSHMDFGEFDEPCELGALPPSRFVDSPAGRMKVTRPTRSAFTECTPRIKAGKNSFRST
jgi:hypothetical protein